MGRERRKNVTVQARVEQDTKDAATEVLESVGLNMSTYLDLSLRRLIQDQRVPFPLPDMRDDDRAA